MTPRGKYIQGSPSSSAVLARDAPFEEVQNIKTVTPPTQDAGRTAEQSAVFLKTASSQNRFPTDNWTPCIVPMTHGGVAQSNITLVIKRPREQGSTIQRKSALRKHKKHKRSRSPVSSVVVSSDQCQSIANYFLQ